MHSVFHTNKLHTNSNSTLLCLNIMLLQHFTVCVETLNALNAIENIYTFIAIFAELSTREHIFFCLFGGVTESILVE